MLRFPAIARALRSCLCLSVSAPVLLMSMEVAAQATAPTPTPTPPEEPIETIVVTGQELNRRDATVSRVVVGREEIERFGDTNLSDVLKRLPGVTVTNSGIAMRGLASGYTQILVNGERVPSNFSIDSLPPETIERIEINRSGSAETSAEAIAGTINFILKKADRDPHTEVTLGFGVSRGKGEPSVNWQRTGGWDDASYLVNALVRRRNFLVTQAETQTAFQPDGTQFIDRSGNWELNGRLDTLSTSPSLTVQLGDQDQIKAQALVNITHDVRDMVIFSDTTLGPPLPYDVSRYNLSYLNFETKLDLSWTRDFEAGNALDASIGILLNGRDGDFEEEGLSRTGDLRMANTVDSEIREYGLVSKGKYSVYTIDDHTIAAGWDGSLRRRDETRIERFAPLPGLTLSDSDLEFDAHVDRVAFYIQDEWQITPTFSTYLGLRGERVETRSSGNSFDTVTNRTQVLSPIIHALWKSSGERNEQLRVAVNRTFRPPRIDSLVPRPYTSPNNTPFTPDELGNPDLRAELAWGLDATYERDWGRETSFSLNAYVRDISNVIRTEMVIRDGRWLIFPVNDGNALAWGVEVDAKSTLSSLIEGAPKIRMRFNLAANWSEVKSINAPNNRIEGQVPLNATFGFDYPLLNDLTIGASFTFRDTADIQRSQNFLEVLPLRRELDFYALWSVTDSSKLRLSVNNSLRQSIRGGGRYVDDDGAWFRNTNRISPITLRASFTTSF